MAKSGLKHIDVGPELTRTEWESEESHELLHGSSFPGSPVERQLFYRDDEHKWYIYDGSDWVWLGGGSGGGMVEHGNEYHDPDFAEASHSHAQLHTQLCEAADFSKLDGIEAGADVTASHAPQAHKASHQDAGADEISVASLSGELADLQKPKDHTHQSSGSGVGGKLDHGLALDGLSDDDHPQYVKHSLATAVSDFLVASGAGAFVKKTLAEVKTLLNWAADIATHAGLTTGVHGVGAGTIAKTSDITATKLDDLSAPDDNTDLDASTSKHGLLKKLGGGTANFLRADGSWAAPPAGIPSKIQDADTNTAWDVEQSADENKIRGKVAGVEAFLIDNAGVLTLAKQSAAKGYLTASVNVTRGSYQKVNLDGTIYDIQGEFNTGTYKFIAKTAGLYLVCGTATWSTYVTNAEFDVLAYKNGGAIQAVSGYFPQTQPICLQCTVIAFLAINDYIELWVYCGGSGSATIYLGEKNTNLFVAKIA